MTTREFIKKLEELGFGYEIGVNDSISVGGITIYETLILGDKYTNKRIVAWIDTEEIGSLETNLFYFKKLNIVRKAELFELLTEYAATPLKKRKGPLRVEVFEELDIDVENDSEEAVRTKLDEMGLEGIFFNIKGWKDDIDDSLVN